MMQADGPGLTLNRARHELLLGAVRDPDIAETSQAFVARINAMARDAIAHLQPGTDVAELLAAQTTAVTTFIAGVFTQARLRRPHHQRCRATQPGYWRRSPPRCRCSGHSVATKSPV